MSKKIYQYSGGGNSCGSIWDFTSDNGPPVTITTSPTPKDAGEFICRKSQDGYYNVLIHQQLTLPIAKRILELINTCEIDIIKKESDEFGHQK